ncbi:MAG: chromate efflux transporter [Methylotenera sp.]|uniref:chromate efflux transporter n=1 Tax=Methylotenera sp. TaxID=2051956 RepID=UPI00248A7850|nr:chromate efflux transporter [Methylotenera sp.]MDI1309602.1 chromate efflux transporter [Methylotenera sp.]
MSLHHNIQTPNEEAPATPTLKEAFWYWLKLGFISFGGPAGQISIMHHDLVEKKRWISEKRFLHALNYCMVLPGPEAQQLATYIGWLMHRTWGGLIAGCLFVLPSFFILMALTFIYLRFGNQPLVAGVLYGIKPAVVAIVLFAAYRIGSRALKNKWLWLISLAAFVAITLLRLPFPLIVLFAALIGYIGSKYSPATFSAGGGHQASDKSFGKAVIDDNTPAPKHAKFNLRHLVKVFVVGITIWILAMAVLMAVYGWQATLTQMGWFFTKAALLTFGGAYAVLPYVYQGAVDHYHWLSATQMIDGLALGETTPGPLIMVVAFVGFMGGWTQHVFGIDNLLLSGVVAASVVTFFTFLPSFLFIFLGAPFIESTQNNLKFTAPLTAITAAVVGVILSLALFFAMHVFMPNQLTIPQSTMHIDWLAVVLAIVGFMALYKLKISIIKLILAYALIGLALSYLI